MQNNTKTLDYVDPKLEKEMKIEHQREMNRMRQERFQKRKKAKDLIDYEREDILRKAHEEAEEEKQKAFDMKIKFEQRKKEYEQLENKLKIQEKDQEAKYIQKEKELPAYIENRIMKNKQIMEQINKLNNIEKLTDKKIENHKLMNKIRNELLEFQNYLLGPSLSFEQSVKLQEKHDQLSNKYEILKQECDQIDEDVNGTKTLEDVIKDLLKIRGRR